MRTCKRRSPIKMQASAQAGRVTLNVGGSLVTTAVSTLEAHSAYFRSLFSRWSLESAEDQAVFLDCDYDAFRVLISYMRSGVVLLPREDVDLCSRVLLQAGCPSPIPSTTSTHSPHNNQLTYSHPLALDKG